MKLNETEQFLAKKQCKPCRKGDVAMEVSMSQTLLAQLSNWQFTTDKKGIKRQFHFKNFEKTMLFINQLASIAAEQDHHPDVNFGYNYCSVLFTTHAIDHLSENDFICAAKLDEIADEK